MPIAVYDLVVFDLAGTTVHDTDDVTRCLRATLKDKAGIHIALKEANTALGRAKDLALAEILTNHGQPHKPADTFVQDLLADFEERMIVHYRDEPTVRELANASKVFAELKSLGVKIGIDTGFSVRVTQAVIDRMGWEKAGLLDAWTSCDQVKQGRPAPYMIYQLMERLGVTHISRVIKIGDTPNDIKMGKAAGCGLTVGVLNGSHNANELQVHNPDVLVPDIGSLVGMVR
jgi:phosphonatase-like hydrolase